jgi:hypothetical protein
MTTTVWSHKNDGQNKESEKGRDQKWKKALARYRKWTVERLTTIENFHPVGTILQGRGGKR